MLRRSFSVSWLSAKYRCATDTARAVKYAQSDIMPVKTGRFWTTSSGRHIGPNYSTMSLGVNSCVPIANPFFINRSGERIHTEQSRVSRNPGYCSTAESSSYRSLMGPACALRPFSCGAPQ